MGKSLFIAEKPSVARQFADCFSETMKKYDGYQESERIVVTWCFGHLVTMSYPEVYDEELKRWRMETLPFIPDDFKYEVLQSAKKQFDIVKGLLNRPDVEKIYVCTDSGREGEYIYRLVRQEAGVKDKKELRVWINSQTDDEIKRGIREAKPISEYDNLSDAAYLRAKEDYLMGINFSRALTIRHGRTMAGFLSEKHCTVSVGRVMTCVLGMVVKREREIRQFVKTPFYRVIGTLAPSKIECEWKVCEGSKYFNSPLLYKENGFKKEEDARELLSLFSPDGKVKEISKKTEKKNPPLLYNLAELQSDCTKLFHISPDETLNIIQDLYEKKLLTYPRTDARVLSSAVAKVIDQNIRGLSKLPAVSEYANHILEKGLFRNIEKSKYTDDKKITDHYAIIPTGQGLSALSSLPKRSTDVYETVVRRFLSIFYPPAEYKKITLDVESNGETLSASFKIPSEKGYLSVMDYSFQKKEEKEGISQESIDLLNSLKKGSPVRFSSFKVKEGETTPPKRYTTGSMILAMENAGNLIEDEELREQIKSQGIGTSATRAEILKKLVEKNHYLSLNKKTQVLTPTLLGEMVTDCVAASIGSLLSPSLTASWEKGLSMVSEGELSADEYMKKLSDFIVKNVNGVKEKQNSLEMLRFYKFDSTFYGKGKEKKEEDKEED